MVNILDNIKLEFALKKMKAAEHEAIWTTPGNAIGDTPSEIKVWGRVIIATRVLRLGNGSYLLVLDGASYPNDESFSIRLPQDLFSDFSQIRDKYPLLLEANGTLFMY